MLNLGRKPKNNPYLTDFGKFWLAVIVFATTTIGGMLVLFYGWIIFNDNSHSTYAIYHVNNRGYAMKVYKWKGFRFPPKTRKLETAVIILGVLYLTFKFGGL